MIEHFPDKTLLAALLFAALAAYILLAVVKEHLQINRLGGRAPVIRGKLPFGRVNLL